VVISVDPSVAHLTGAMGKPVWILLPWNPDWRWLLKREDSPWYPTARLFRQTTIGDWKSVLERLHTALEQYFRELPDSTAHDMPGETLALNAHEMPDAKRADGQKSTAAHPRRQAIRNYLVLIVIFVSSVSWLWFFLQDKLDRTLADWRQRLIKALRVNPVYFIPVSGI
jgi:hypothetical protein